jgi:hypothetical protein
MRCPGRDEDVSTGFCFKGIGAEAGANWRVSEIEEEGTYVCVQSPCDGGPDLSKVLFAVLRE